MPEPNGWNEWSKFVLKELERLNLSVDQLKVRVEVLHADVMLLQLKAGLWGAAAGALPVIAMVLLNMFHK